MYKQLVRASINQLVSRFSIEKFINARSLNRVFNFCNSNNLRTDVPILLIRDSDDLDVLANFVSQYLPSLDLRGTTMSYYIFPLDIVVLNLTDYTPIDYMTLGLNYIMESILVHELAHASNPWRHLYYTEHIPNPLDEDNFPPLGFYWDKIDYLEESFAVYWELQYVKFLKNIRVIKIPAVPTALDNGFINPDNVLTDNRSMFHAARFHQAYTYLRSGDFLTQVIGRFPLIIDLMMDFRASKNRDDLIKTRNSLLSYLHTIEVNYPVNILTYINSLATEEEYRIGCVKRDNRAELTYSYNTKPKTTIHFQELIDSYQGPWKQTSLFNFYKQSFKWPTSPGLPGDIELYMIMFEYQYG
jgi:hypothetical protein